MLFSFSFFRFLIFGFGTALTVQSISDRLNVGDQPKMMSSFGRLAHFLAHRFAINLRYFPFLTLADWIARTPLRV